MLKDRLIETYLERLINQTNIQIERKIDRKVDRLMYTQKVRKRDLQKSYLLGSEMDYQYSNDY